MKIHFNIRFVRASHAGHALKVVRKSMGITRDALGRYLGTSGAFIAKYEKGRIGIPAPIFKKLFTNGIGRMRQK